MVSEVDLNLQLLGLGPVFQISKLDTNLCPQKSTHLRWDIDKCCARDC